MGLTTASEFGGLNICRTRLNGETGNPWAVDRTPGGSSGGSASAVAGGLLTLATGGDGGGSIRIPAGFCGLVGMKGTTGRIPRGPQTQISPMTVVAGCLSRSVRDVARYYDVCAGYHRQDPYSLPSEGAWETRLGTHDLSGLRVAVDPALGSATVLPELADLVTTAAADLTAGIGLRRTEVAIEVGSLGFEWAMANMAGLLSELGDLWPDCADDLTDEIRLGLELAESTYDLRAAAHVEARRTSANEAMARVFGEVDLVVSATNPDTAFPAGLAFNTRVGDQRVDLENNGLLTIPSNLWGNPAVSVPVGLVDGMPVGMQIMAAHHRDSMLLDVARWVEREQSWPLVSPGAPC